MARRRLYKDYEAEYEGAPCECLASPITTGFSPAQGGTLDKVRNLGSPADPQGRLSKDVSSKLLR